MRYVIESNEISESVVLTAVNSFPAIFSAFDALPVEERAQGFHEAREVLMALLKRLEDPELREMCERIKFSELRQTKLEPLLDYQVENIDIILEKVFRQSTPRGVVDTQQTTQSNSLSKLKTGVRGEKTKLEKVNAFINNDTVL